MPRRATSICEFPVELLQNIALNLSNNDLWLLTQTCAKLHDIAALVLYRNVTAYGTTGVRYLKTIADSPEKYASITRTLSFVSVKNRELHSTFSLFTAALGNLKQLAILSITICPDRTPFLSDTLASTPHSTDGELVVRSNRRIDLGINDFTSTLPNLRFLSFHGDYKLSRFTAGNNVTVLFTSVWLSEKQLNFLISSLANGSAANITLEELHIRLDVFLALNIGNPLTKLGQTLINLRRLSVLTPRADAMFASKWLATSPLFPRLTTFRLNDWTDNPPFRKWISKIETLGRQRRYITDAGTLHEDLDTVVTGTIHWTKDFDTSWMMQEKTAPYRVENMTNKYDFSPIITLNCFFDVNQSRESGRLHSYLIHNDEQQTITQLRYPVVDEFGDTSSADSDSSDHDDYEAYDTDTNNTNANEEHEVESALLL